MTKFLLQTYAIKGIKAESEKCIDEIQFLTKQIEDSTSDYYIKDCKERREELLKQLDELDTLRRDVENYEF